jgi:hypothetical protein
LTGQSGNTGDIALTFVRDPVNIVRGKLFDWTLTVEIPNGGFAEATGPYTNEAPENGYQQTITVSMPASASNWANSFDQTYYFTARSGQIYGRIKFRLKADYQPPPTHFEMDVYTNPSGSRNLEFDPAKQIKSQ